MLSLFYDIPTYIKEIFMFIIRFSFEPAGELAKRMKKCMEENGYGGSLACRYALKSMGVSLD